VLGLYVHVPFCAAICNYCNFNRGLFDADLKGRYVQAVLAEISAHADGTAADTIFFGGGTPSLLDPSDVAAIVERCRASFDMPSNTEVTLEANPESVTGANLEGFRAAGVNRLSFGVQSFRDDELKRLSRLHSARRAEIALSMASAAGFTNISLDLMMGLPEQAIAQWAESVETVIGLGPEHVSLYMLEVYPNSPLQSEMARAGWSAAPDDEVADMYLLAMERLEGAGYLQYEISNVAKPGRESRHNLKYWTDQEWLGFGPGAHSTWRGVRSRNVSATPAYIETASRGGLLTVETRRLSDRTRLEEALFTGLRLNQGLDLGGVTARYGVDVWEAYREELRPFMDQGLLIYDHARQVLRLTRPGMLMAHEVMAVFLRGAEG
jgi:oxygen-independent coproporphyrinogen-3 oxidase